MAPKRKGKTKYALPPPAPKPKGALSAAEKLKAALDALPERQRAVYVALSGIGMTRPLHPVVWSYARSPWLLLATTYALTHSVAYEEHTALYALNPDDSGLFQPWQLVSGPTLSTRPLATPDATAPNNAVSFTLPASMATARNAVPCLTVSRSHTVYALDPLFTPPLSPAVVAAAARGDEEAAEAVKAASVPRGWHNVGSIGGTAGGVEPVPATTAGHHHHPSLSNNAHTTATRVVCVREPYRRLFVLRSRPPPPNWWSTPDNALPPAFHLDALELGAEWLPFVPTAESHAAAQTALQFAREDAADAAHHPAAAGAAAAAGAGAGAGAGGAAVKSRVVQLMAQAIVQRLPVSGDVSRDHPLFAQYMDGAAARRGGPGGGGDRGGEQKRDAQNTPQWTRVVHGLRAPLDAEHDAGRADGRRRPLSQLLCSVGSRLILRDGVFTRHLYAVDTRHLPYPLREGKPLEPAACVPESGERVMGDGRAASGGDGLVETLEQPPVPVVAGSTLACAWRGQLVLMYGAQRNHTAFTRYDFEEKRWHVMPPLKDMLVLELVPVDDGWLYAIGIDGPYLSSPSTTGIRVSVFDPEHGFGGSWKPLAKLPTHPADPKGFFSQSLVGAWEWAPPLL